MNKDYILHLLRVGKLARSFCRLYYNDESIANVAFMCGFTHDIGKLLVDQEVLEKKGKLEAHEFEEIKRHSRLSYELLKLAGLGEYSMIALYHHERYDGQGYPTSAKGSEIPDMSQIISICDVFDAMTSNRSYRKNKIDVMDTIGFIKANSGERFNPHFANYFVENIELILLENELEDYISA